MIKNLVVWGGNTEDSPAGLLCEMEWQPISQQTEKGGSTTNTAIIGIAT